MADDPTPELGAPETPQLSAVAVVLRVLAVVIVPALLLLVVKMFLE